jgi:hypothetical protein
LAVAVAKLQVVVEVEVVLVAAASLEWREEGAARPGNGGVWRGDLPWLLLLLFLLLVLGFLPWQRRGCWAGDCCGG